jgi:Ca2+-binding EF-hand superfamily protein
MLDEQELSGVHESSTSSTQTEGLAGVGTKADMPTTRHQEHAVQGDLIKQLDTDGDGKISQQEAEVEARLSDNWDEIDRNGDGKLDSNELDRVDQ